MFELKRDFGGIEINQKFTLKDLIEDASIGGSARLDWWLEEQTTGELVPKVIRSFRWNLENPSQSEQTLLCMCNFIAMTDQSDQFFNEISLEVPKPTRDCVEEIIHLLQGGVRHSMKPSYEQLNLINLNLEILSIVSEIQQSESVNSEVVEYLDKIASISRIKNRHEENYSMVDLYLNSRDFSFLFAQIDYLHNENGRVKFLKFLKENIDLQIGTPVPYPDTMEEFQILMAFTSNPPNILHIPFMEHVDVGIWHHIYTALERRA